MRPLILLILLLVFTSSCRSSKHIINSKIDKPQIEIAKTDSVPIKNDIDINKVKPDTILVNNTQKEKKEESTKTIKFTHKNWTKLLQKHVSNEGNVNYKGFKAERRELLAYIKDLGKHTPNATSSQKETLAFWINAYNAMTIDLILRHYPIKSIKDIKKPWQQRYWKLNEKWYNLNEIEHKILRKMKEPRIHFAIVCASFSCPKLQNKAFEASNLETQLENATKTFINDPKRNVITPNKLEMSKIFNWFDKDFLTPNTNIIDYINKYATIKASQKATKRFMDYNWSLNE